MNKNSKVIDYRIPVYNAEAGMHMCGASCRNQLVDENVVFTVT